MCSGNSSLCDPCPCINFNWSLWLLFFPSTLQSTNRIIYFLRPRFDYRPDWLLSELTYNKIFTEQSFLLVRIRCVYIYIYTWFWFLLLLILVIAKFFRLELSGGRFAEHFVSSWKYKVKKCWTRVLNNIIPMGRKVMFSINKKTFALFGLFDEN